MSSKKVIIICGTRPNFIKIAPLVWEFNKRNITYEILHTGQHYDINMDKVFFSELGISKPIFNFNFSIDYNLTSLLHKLSEYFNTHIPSLVVVVGDVYSTLIAALASYKEHVPLVHIESGLRSFDLSMPEEINRIVVDQLSDYLFVSESAGIENLLSENVSRDKIYYVGNIMIDTLCKYYKIIKNAKFFNKFGRYALVTFHRPFNVDDRENLSNILEVFKFLSKKIKLVIPLHPRTKINIEKYNFSNFLSEPGIEILPPLGYIDFLSLVFNSQMVFTDSGGVQEETTFLNIPCITLRENTERPVTIEKGSNTLSSINAKALLKCYDLIVGKKYKQSSKIAYWDGHTAERIVDVIEREIL